MQALILESERSTVMIGSKGNQFPKSVILYTRPQHNPLFGFPLVMCFQKLPVFTLLGDCSVGFRALFFDFGRTYQVGSGSGSP
jgi:hypothetical protein